MCQVTVVRILLVIITGIILYSSLMYVFGWGEGKSLKKRSKASIKERESFKSKIVLVYLSALFVITTLCFLTIKYWIRGVE